MKLAFYRNLQRKLDGSGPLDEEECPQLSKRLDLKLRDINCSFQYNFKLQEIYLDVASQRPTLHSSEIKHYYDLFTDCKAESLLFGHSLSDPECHQLTQNPLHKEAIRNLKRLHCRLIQKIMVKISYYLMNSRTLNFLHSQIAEQVRRCEVLMRRMADLNDLSTINEVVQSIYAQNQQLQLSILEELVSKGYLVSDDQFYRINGVDLDHPQYFSRKQSIHYPKEKGEKGAISHNKSQVLSDQHSQTSSSSSEESFEDLPSKFQLNLNKLPPTRTMQKKETKHIQRAPIIMPRGGVVDLQQKYRLLLVNIEQMIAREEENTDWRQNHDIDFQDKITEEEPDGPNSPEKSSEQVSPRLKHKQRSSRQKVANFSTPIAKIIDINKQFTPEQVQSDSSRQGRHLQPSQKSGSSSFLPDSESRGRNRQMSSPFFSKSFVSALKSMDKTNLRDSKNRAGLKRMSEQLIEYTKQELEEDKEKEMGMEKGSGFKERTLTKQKSIVRNRVNNNSIVKLLNIYNNKKEGQFIEKLRKELVSHKNQKLAKQRPSKLGHLGKNIHIMRDIYEEPSHLPAVTAKTINDSLQKYPSQSYIAHHPFQTLDSAVSTPTNNSASVFLQKYQDLQAKKEASYMRAPRLTEGRPSARNSHNPFLLGRRSVTPLKDSSLLGKDSMFTMEGIGKAGHESKANKQNAERGMKEVVESPSGRRWEVYDRVRRLILR